MPGTLLVFLGVVYGLVVAQQPTGVCQDLDTQSCIGFHKAKPDLCNDPAFYTTTCRRFCGNCPTECYYCPQAVRNPRDCNTTKTCGPSMMCMTKHLMAADGHQEYIMTCETKEACDLLTDGFGKRNNDERSSAEDGAQERHKRGVLFTCCDKDLCNFEVQTTTATTTTTSTTTQPPTTTFCDRDDCYIGPSGTQG